MLRSLRLPASLLALVSLLRGASVAILLDSVPSGFEVTSGIWQLCPTSGALWDTSYDPLLRYLGSRLARLLAASTVYADDVAISCAMLGDVLPVVFDAFHIIRRASTLGIHHGKRHIVNCGEGSNDELRCLSAVAIGAVMAMAVLYTLYLGVLVGL